MNILSKTFKTITLVSLLFTSSITLADRNGDMKILFAWAENYYPSLFSPKKEKLQQQGVWKYVYYSATNTYIGVNDNNEVWVLGDVFGGLLYIDKLSTLLEGTDDVNPETFPLGDYSYLKTYLNWMIKKGMADQNVEGLSIAIVDNQQIVWSQGFGFADTANNIKATSETIYRAGSISKLFTDTLVMKLAERDELDIDEPFKAYLPSFSMKTRFLEADPITPRNIMTHHSGLPFNIVNGMLSDSPDPFRGLIEQLKEDYVAYPPNTIMAYSNVGITLLGLMLEEVTEESFSLYAKQQLFDPLGMRHTSFSNALKGEKVSKTYFNHEQKTETPLRDVPAAGLNANVLDLSNFIKMLLAGGKANNQQILERETIKEMLTPQNKGVELDLSFEFGLGWFIHNNLNIGTIVEHGGATLYHRSQLSILPEHKLGIVVLSNSPSTDGLITEITNTALKLAFSIKTGQEQPAVAIQPKVATRALTLSEIKNYVGQYVSNFGLINMTLQSNKLKVEIDGIEKESTGQIDGNIRLEGFEGGSFSIKTTPDFELLVFNWANNKQIFGEKIKQTSISSDWKKRLGEYTVTNLAKNQTDITTPKNVILREQEGVIMLELSIRAFDVNKLKYPIKPLSENEAIILGFGQGKRETVRAVIVNGEEQIAYSGYLFQKN